jgi:hypothetical protein
METTIKNLNKVQDQREFLINQILYREGNGKTNSQYDALEKKLNNKSFAYLDKKATEYIGNWRIQFAIN